MNNGNTVMRSMTTAWVMKGWAIESWVIKSMDEGISGGVQETGVNWYTQNRGDQGIVL